MDHQEPQLVQEDFVALFTANQRRIFGFVVSISPSWADADEIFQRVCLVLWKKWPSYEHEDKFLAWALQIARLEVVKFMSQRSRRKEIYSDEALDLIQSRTCEMSADLSERMVALEKCVKKLPEEQRDLVRRCYSGTQKIKEIAEAIGVNAQSLYLKLQRIRKVLHQCVDKSLAEI
ncbi:MAG: sigma-70 family RNA polymerase sigma factor [Rhodopirellula sp. JB053]